MSKSKDPFQPARDPVLYLKQCVEIVPEAIHEEYVRLPADLAYWNAQYADAQRAFLLAKVEADILERELYPVLRVELEATGKVTEKMIESALASSAAWKESKVRVAEAEAEKARLYGVLDAVRTKRDMLVSLGAHLRAEMDGSPQLRDESRHFSAKMGFGGA